jgi:hypothetical protein
MVGAMNSEHASLVILDSICVAGGSGSNEDLIGWSRERCWVLDGATPVTRSLIDPESDARWLVQQVDEILRTQEIDEALTADIRSGIGSIASAVADRLLIQGFPDHELPPACSLGLIQLKHGRLEAAIAGDVTVYFPQSRVLLEDLRFGSKEKAAHRESAGAGLESIAVREDIAQRRRRYIDGPGDMYVLSNNRRVSEGVRHRTVPLHDGDEVIMLSDGFARLVDSYEIFGSYSDLYNSIRDSGLFPAYEALRDFESTKRSRSNFKSADDASALYAVVRNS